MAEPLVAEFDTPERLIVAATTVRALGFADLDTFTPFPIAELDEALAIRRTRLPWLVLAGGFTGCFLALLIQWWTNAIDFPIDVGGRPLNSLPSDILIVFETTVLAASSTAFLAVLLGSKLPRLHHPNFDIHGIERTTVDSFALVIRSFVPAGAHDASETHGTIQTLRAELARLGAVRIVGPGEQGASR